MAKTYILGNLNSLKFEEINLIESPEFNKFESDELYKYVQNLVVDLKFDRLIIDLDCNSKSDLLKVAYYIRLSIEFDASRLIPILFISTQSLESILYEQKSLANIIYTKGCNFENSSNLAVINRAIETTAALSTETYYKDFLSQIEIYPDELTGRHSVGNIWGIKSLAKVLDIDIPFHENLNNLYFKFLEAKAHAKESTASNSINMEELHLSGSKLKILLIDDEGDKGWDKIIKYTFRSSKELIFENITERINHFDQFSQSAKDKILKEDYNLIFLDLRLNGTEEENTLKTESFSGVSVLNRIKKQNKGNQVIILTASNKAWNLKELLFNLKADGYYIKESPEVSIDQNHTITNYNSFISQIQTCLKKSSLKRIIYEISALNLILKNHYSDRLYNDFVIRVKSNLDTAYQLLDKSHEIAIYNNYAYLQLFYIIEEFANNNIFFKYEAIASNKYYVQNFRGNYELAFSKLEKDKKESKQFLETKVNFSNSRGYFLSDKQNKKQAPDRFNVDYVISTILLIRHEKRSTKSTNWPKINYVRNEKVGHNGKQKVKTLEIMELLEFIKDLLSITIKTDAERLKEWAAGT